MSEYVLVNVRVFANIDPVDPNRLCAPAKAVVHAFYKEHGIAGHHEEWADEGAELLLQSHLNIT